MKTCITCSDELDKKLFTKDGFICIKCRKLDSSRRYRETHREELREKNKIYKLQNPEIIKKWRENSNIKKEYNRKYFLDNKERLNKYKNNWFNEKMKSDIGFKLKKKIKTTIKDAFRGKYYKRNKKIIDILGCSIDDFKSYLESKFESWMSWENHGLYNGELNYGWDIDHIIPISTAKTEEDIIKLSHFLNFQPLCSKINRDIKRSKYYDDIISI